MKDNFQDWTQRAQRYWYVDGLAEIGAGAVIIFLGLFFVISGLIKDDGFRGLFIAVGQIIIVIALPLLARVIVARMKERVTYPRTGYIAYRRQGLSRRIGTILLTIGVAAVVGVVVYLIENWMNLRWLPVVIGLTAALLILVIAYRIGLPRFYILTGYTLAIGVITGLLSLAEPYDSGVFFSGLGLGWLVSGGVTLLRYMRNTRPADQTMMDGERG